MCENGILVSGKEVAKVKKVVKNTPKERAATTDDEAAALEKRLRSEIDSWARLQSDDSKSRFKVFRRLQEKLLPTFKKKKRT